MKTNKRPKRQQSAPSSDRSQGGRGGRNAPGLAPAWRRWRTAVRNGHGRGARSGGGSFIKLLLITITFNSLL